MTIAEHLHHGPRRPRAEFIDLAPKQVSFADAVLHGLKRRHKAIPCRFLYDARGSALFDQICELPEYYPTRTETAILRDNAEELAALVGRDACLVELGSGSSLKTRILLDELHAPAAYVPIDVSRDHLREAATAIARDYPDLRVVAICGDYAGEISLPRAGRRRVGFFPGSTIGNLGAPEARALMLGWRRKLGEGGLMILGADLRKDPAMLEAAYNDAAGVTEAFIKNILVRMRDELDVEIDPADFAYEARYAKRRSRVEMHLRSLRDQDVTVCGVRIRFAAGERVHVENSRKYGIEDIRALGAAAGFAPVACFTDAADLFSVHVWSAA